MDVGFRASIQNDAVLDGVLNDSLVRPIEIILVVYSKLRTAPSIVYSLGIDWDGPVATDLSSALHIPETPDLLTPLQLTELQQNVHPLELCDDLAVSLYLMEREFILAAIN